MSVFFSPINDESIEDQALQAGNVEQSTFTQKIFGTGEEQKTLSKIRLEEQQKGHVQMKKLRESWRVEDLKQVREWAQKEEDSLRHANSEAYREKAEHLRAHHNPAAEHYEQIANKREEAAEERFLRLKRYHDEDVSEARVEQKRELKEGIRHAIGQRLSSFKSSVRGATPARPVTTSRRAA